MWRFKLGQLILAGFAGAVIIIFVITTLIYRGQIKGAESERDDAIKIASQALDAKQSAEEGFAKMRELFDEKMKMPVAAIITQEQLDQAVRYLAERLMISTARDIPSLKN
jgi:hypothetical protein